MLIVKQTDTITVTERSPNFLKVSRAGAQGIPGPEGPSVTDGDKGDIVVSGDGASWTIDPSLLSSFMRGVVSSANVAAFKAAVDLEAGVDYLPVASLSTDGTLAANSDTLIPSQKAVKAYADGLIAANDAMVFKGVIDASANPNYPAANRGWTYRISVAGKIGGASGPSVEVGDIVLCLTDGTASGNQATVGSNWSIIQTNTDGAMVTASYPTLVALEGISFVAGDIIYFSGADTPVRLAKGTAAQVLAMNAGATAPEWITPSTGSIGGTTGANDNRLLRSDGTGGATVQASTVAVSDAGAMTGVLSVDIPITDWTPTVTASTGSITTVSATGRYQKVGKRVYFEATITLTTNGTGGGYLQFTLPSTPVRGGSVSAFNNANVLAITGQVVLGSAVCRLWKYDGTYPGLSGAGIIVNGFYEEA